jgi:hypothetical protein
MVCELTSFYTLQFHFFNACKRLGLSVTVGFILFLPAFPLALIFNRPPYPSPSNEYSLREVSDSRGRGDLIVTPIRGDSFTLIVAIAAVRVSQSILSSKISATETQEEPIW